MNIRALVLAAGKGTRMRTNIPKVLHPLSGETVIESVLERLCSAGIQDIWVVTGYARKQVEEKLKGKACFVYQSKQLGTGHAVLEAGRSFKGFKGLLLIVAGDVPLIEPRTIKRFIAEHRKAGNACSCLSAVLNNAHSYGRILRGKNKAFLGIAEELEATPDERKIKEVNTGIYAFSYPALCGVLGKLTPSKKKKELYLTDTIELLLNRGEKVAAYPLAHESETRGINTQEDLSKLEEKMNLSNISALQSKGVTVIMPSQTYIQKGVKVGKGTVIHPFTWIEKGVVIGSNCEIGPFAKIRRGSKVESNAAIGSFVEVVRSRVGKGTRIKHLSYFGDSRLGKNVNVGAGTITANYDGKRKSVTQVGDSSFLGIHTALVAPVVLGKGVKTGAGSVVTARQKIKNKKVIAGVPAKELRKKRKK